MNLTGMPPGWYVGLTLPDGRTAIGDAEDPGQARVVAAIRRISKAVSAPHGRCPGGRQCRNRHAGKAEDYAAVAAWLDETEPLPGGQLFTLEAT